LATPAEARLSVFRHCLFFAALSIPSFSSIFLSGAFLFFLFDRAIETKEGLLAQAMAMLMDFIPEAIALGAVFSRHHKLGILLAFFVGLQNLPESFNAYFDLRKSNHSSKKSSCFF
jgi:ZIP family zinc transporter